MALVPGRKGSKVGFGRGQPHHIRVAALTALAQAEIERQLLCLAKGIDHVALTDAEIVGADREVIRKWHLQDEAVAVLLGLFRAKVGIASTGATDATHRRGQPAWL